MMLGLGEVLGCWGRGVNGGSVTADREALRFEDAEAALDGNVRNLVAGAQVVRRRESAADLNVAAHRQCPHVCCHALGCASVIRRYGLESWAQRLFGHGRKQSEQCSRVVDVIVQRLLAPDCFDLCCCRLVAGAEPLDLASLHLGPPGLVGGVSFHPGLRFAGDTYVEQAVIGAVQAVERGALGHA